MATDSEYLSYTPRPSAATVMGRLLAALVGGFVLFLLLLMAGGLIFDATHAGKVFPGVSVAGVELSDLPRDEAAALLTTHLNYPVTGRIIFRDGAQVWMAQPQELGLYFDPESSAQAAFEVGRRGNLLSRVFDKVNTWYGGRNLPPHMVYDQRQARQYLENLSVHVNLPTREATLQIDGVQVSAIPGQVGRVLDIDATLQPLNDQLAGMMDTILPLVIHDQPPAILDVSDAAERARRILAAPLTLTVPDAQPGDPGPWTLEPERLARLLQPQRVADGDTGRYEIGFDTAGLRSFVEGIAPSLARSPQNARYTFDDDAIQLVPLQAAVVGRTVDIAATVKAIEVYLSAGDMSVPLTLNYVQPPVSNEVTAESLGIRELVSKQTSYFYGSDAARIQNIETAAARFNGVLVAPGETFSMAAVMGDVSLDTGYAEALIIYGDRTIKGVGGGVCQVSTTLFRTAFFGGFPIVERHSHAYRVGYYELNAQGGYDTSLAGLDATVYVPVVDFKFTNDTPNWLLMETNTNAAARTLTWKFYSTSQGRTVEWNTTGLQNITDPPEPSYIENSALGQGEVHQVDWAVQGADVTVTRSVLANGQVLFQDTFVTHYVPWGDKFEIGPGTDIDPNPKKKRG
jgi:vancomycin resistance protein YoaR